MCSDCIVVNSKFTRSVFEKSFPRIRTKHLGVLYPPVDVSVFERYACPLPRHATLFVSLNRFERKKNVQLAIHALRDLRACISDELFQATRLVVAGGYDPNNAENLVHQQELKDEVRKCALDDHVQFMTSVSDAKKKELLATAQAILYTPSNEHFGIVPVEAMTCQTPVIAVNSGGPLESLLDGETGFLCEPDSGAFAAAMAKVCGPQHATFVAAMGAKGRLRARALFSLETFGDSLAASIRGIASHQ